MQRTKREAMIEIENGCNCEYCETAPAEGFVPEYDAILCIECYEDHHT